MHTTIFLISLIICSFTASSVIKHKQSQLTEDQLINYDLTQIQDCGSYSIFQNQLDGAIASNSNDSTILSNANDTIFEVQALINKIIDLENARNGTSSFLLKSKKNHRISRIKSEKKKDHLELNQEKIINDLKVINEVYDLVSEDGKKNIEKLNNLFVLVSSRQASGSTVDICNQVLYLLQQLDNDILNNLAQVEEDGQKLADKENDSLTVASDLNC